MPGEGEAVCGNHETSGVRRRAGDSVSPRMALAVGLLGLGVIAVIVGLVLAATHLMERLAGR